MTMAARHLRAPCNFALTRNGTRIPSASASRMRCLLMPGRAQSARNINIPRSKINSDVKSVAVLGGGLSGLSTAFYLTKFFPGLPITLYEKSSRPGGWLSTEERTIDGKRLQFEKGPRSIRPASIAGIVTLDMIRELDILDQIVAITEASPAVRNRYIYYDNHLCTLPNSARGLFLLRNSPIVKGIFSGLLGEYFRKKRPDTFLDESVYNFVSRRINSTVAENLVSAIFHGIYAGDIKQLSIKSVLPNAWRLEGQAGSLTKGLVMSLMKRPGMKVNMRDVHLRRELAQANKWTLSKMENDGVAMYTFLDGIETLSKELVKYLKKQHNVVIKTNAQVKSIVPRNVGEKSLSVQLKNNLPAKSFSHVISTLFAPVTSSILPEPIPPLASVEAVTVQVVNFYYRDPNILPVIGFGYLIPQSVPRHENPEYALGVIFDSTITPPTSALPDNATPHAQGTKLTVMMGGHYWKGRTEFPDDEMAMFNACKVLFRHLRIREVPDAYAVTLQKDCIPQYTVGHDSRMEFAHELLKMQFGGRLAVAGASYAGVGLNDCVRSAWEVVNDLAGAGAGLPFSIDKDEWTGLHAIGDSHRWMGEIVKGGKIKFHSEVRDGSNW